MNICTFFFILQIFENAISDKLDAECWRWILEERQLVLYNLLDRDFPKTIINICCITC